MSPNYVRRGGLDTQPAPWVTNDVSAHVFGLTANGAALQALCDRCLNVPSGNTFDYRPVVNMVALTFQAIKGLHSTSPQCTQALLHDYNEATFWVLVKDHSIRSSGRSEFLIPYIFAENSVAVACGREVFGYPKEHAIVAMNETALHFSVKCLAAKQMGPGARSIAMSEIVQIRRKHSDWEMPLAPALGTDLLPKLREAQKGLELFEPALLWLGSFQEYLKKLVSMRLDFVFLRELQAIAGKGVADLQQITTAPADPFSPAAVWPHLASFELYLPPYASHLIAQDLGLNVKATSNTVDVDVAFRIPLAFTLGAGRVIWP